MKKLLIFVAVCLATAAQATILRVSNVVNSGAPYTTIPDAIAAATAGDTIIVDGSPDVYNTQTGSGGSLVIDKRLVLMGPGYLLTENGVKLNGDQAATLTRDLEVAAEATGTIIQGLQLQCSGYIDIQATNVVITRCKIDCPVYIATIATNFVLHQNLITKVLGRASYNNYRPYNAQVTNNIFTFANNSSSNGTIVAFRESKIAYNTITKANVKGSSTIISDIQGCTVENNIFFGDEVTYDGNTLTNNYWGNATSPLKGCTTDLDVQKVMQTNTDLPADKGAFAGDDPYVISGIPAGPTIEDITVPATIEQGGTLNVTIKLGIQK